MLSFMSGLIVGLVIGIAIVGYITLDSIRDTNASNRELRHRLVQAENKLKLHGAGRGQS